MQFAGRATLLWKRLVYVTLHSVEMLCGQSYGTRADVSLFVACLFMARQMTMGVGGRPAARDRLHSGCPNLEDGLGQV